MAGTVPKSWFLAAGAVAQLAAAQSEDEWKTLLAQAAAQMSCPVKQRSVQVRFPLSQKNFISRFSQCCHKFILSKFALHNTVLRLLKIYQEICNFQNII
jgi:hypothetical protein